MRILRALPRQVIAANLVSLLGVSLLVPSLPARAANPGVLPSSAASAIVLNETGSSLLEPLFRLWVPAYAAVDPAVTITAQATNSGEGIRRAIEGTARIGTSDAYFSDEEAEHNPQILTIPLAISAQLVAYHIPGLDGAPLRLDGPTLAGIYSGTIRNWNAAPIAALNPGVALPDHEIIPVRRADPSGDSFVFTQFLDFSTQSWEDRIGYGTVVAWPPVDGERVATGNAGMLHTLATTPFSVAYIGVSFRSQLAQAQLAQDGCGIATLKNQAGKFVLPSAGTVTEAAAALDRRTPPDERLSLVYAPGDNSYPLVNYEYAVVSIRQPTPEIAAAIRRFLLWAIAADGGNAAKFLDPVGFVSLPDFIRALSENQIRQIAGPQTASAAP